MRFRKIAMLRERLRTKNPIENWIGRRVGSLGERGKKKVGA